MARRTYGNQIKQHLTAKPIIGKVMYLCCPMNAAPFADAFSPIKNLAAQRKPIRRLHVCVIPLPPCSVGCVYLFLVTFLSGAHCFPPGGFPPCVALFYVEVWKACVVVGFLLVVADWLETNLTLETVAINTVRLQKPR